MSSFAEYLPIYIDDAMIRAGQREIKVQASNFMRTDCFEAVHRNLHDRATAELDCLWRLIDALDRNGQLNSEFAHIVQTANLMRLKRFDLLWTQYQTP